MSQENVEVVRRFLEGFVATGEPAWSALDEAIEVHDHDILDAADYRGHAGVRRWMADWEAAWSEYRVEPEKFVDAGEQAVAMIRQRTTGASSGLMLDRKDAIVFTVRGREITRVDFHNNRQQALKAVGLAE
jgi:ketosteroid isomerase-like protein